MGWLGNQLVGWVGWVIIGLVGLSLGWVIGYQLVGLVGWLVDWTYKHVLNMMTIVKEYTWRKYKPKKTKASQQTHLALLGIGIEVTACRREVHCAQGHVAQSKMVELVTHGTLSSSKNLPTKSTGSPGFGNVSKTSRPKIDLPFILIVVTIILMIVSTVVAVDGLYDHTVFYIVAGVVNLTLLRRGFPITWPSE